MFKKIIVYILIILVVLGVGFFAYSKFKNNPQITENPPETKSVILFYGDTCPHCQDLEKWIVENKIEEKVEFSSLEVYNNESNRDLLIEKATTCGITDNIGVPFLWTGENCLIGNEQIQQFFENKINENAK
jgi:glutaredoxin